MTKADNAAAGVRLSASQARVLWTTSLVSSLIMLDSNIVAVSLPALGRSLGVSFTAIEWVVSAYLVAYAALLLGAGAFADRYGRKRAMLVGLIVFAVSSAACGAATSSLFLDLARAAQGVGGSLLLTAALAIITHDFAGALRARAFAVWGACLGVALTAGPIIGGVITDWFGWRWVFLVNVPVCVALVGATIRWITESHDPDATRLDLWGVVTFTPGLFFLIWALTDGNDAGWSSVDILARFAIALICFCSFGLAERWQNRPMVDFSLFRHRTFTGAVIAMIGYGGTAQVMVFYLPLYLQNAYGLTPAKAGLGMIPFAVPMVVVPHIWAKLTGGRSGRTALAIGLAVTAVSNLLFWAIARSMLPYPAFALAMIVAGIGAGILNGETVKVIGAAVSPERAGMASGLASTTRFIGILLGVAGLGAIISTIARDHFLAAPATRGLPGGIVATVAKRVVSGDLSGATSLVPQALQASLRSAGQGAFSRGFADSGLAAALIAAIACVLTFVLVHDDAGRLGAVVHPVEFKCSVIDCRHPI